MSRKKHNGYVYVVERRLDLPNGFDWEPIWGETYETMSEAEEAAISQSHMDYTVTLRAAEYQRSEP